MLFAIDPATGNIKWSNSIASPYGSFGATTETAEFTGSAAISPTGTNLHRFGRHAGGDEASLYSFNPDGTTNWIAPLGDNTAVSLDLPALSSNGTIANSRDGRNHSGSQDQLRASGNPLRKDQISGGSFRKTRLMEFITRMETTSAELDGSPVEAADGTIYFVTEGYRLYAVSPGGQLRWFLPVPGFAEPDCTPALGSDGTIYLGSKSQYIYAVNPDGSLKWIFNEFPGDPGTPDFGGPVEVQSEPVIGPDGTIYVSANGLFAINPDGTQKWFMPESGLTYTASPALAADGTIYFGSDFPFFFAVTSNGSPAWNSTNISSIFRFALGCSGWHGLCSDLQRHSFRVLWLGSAGHQRALAHVP